MKRRSFLALTPAALALAGHGAAQSPPQSATQNPAFPQIAPDHPLQQAWHSWRTLCLTQEGRVVDGFQGDASHSEGQGYGLTLAAIFGDGGACQRIVDWTENHLALRPDALLAWRWQPDTSPQVADPNNASDGDLFYAWGLLIAAARLNRPEWHSRAAAIARDLARLCVAPHPDGSETLILLPAATGFARDEGVVLNPSYYMPRALQDLARETDMPVLSRLAEDGAALIETLAGDGPVPDWILLTPRGIEAPPEGFSRLSGYEAIRVPLFALWSDAPRSAAIDAYLAAIGTGPDAGTAIAIDPASGEIAERSSHAGYGAIAALARCAARDGVGAAMPGFRDDQPYYPATLHLMALVVQATLYPRCVPL